jgi:uncharacterized membrane protein YjgN (DUF898 family)
MTFVELPGAVPSVRPGTVPVPLPRPVRFTGNGRAYLRLLTRGAVLLAVTLGIYRFWLTTDIRRFLWVNTEVDGDSLEYTGTALELLIGFLIAMAILVPLYVVLFVFALNLGVIGQFIGILAFPVLAYLGHFAIYRARRYRLTRTVYRGIRFHQGGSGLLYAVYALLWWVLILLTLGLVYPFAQASLERYKMKNTYYGNLPGRFDGSGFRLFFRGVLMWLAVMGPLAAAIIVPIAAIDWSKIVTAFGNDPDAFMRRLMSDNPELVKALAGAIGLLNLSVLFAVVLFPVFQAMVLRWWIDGLRVGEVSIGSQLRVGTIYYAYVRFIGWSLLFGLVLAIAGTIGAILMFAFGTTFADKQTTEIVATIGVVLLYVVMMLGYSTIYQVTVRLTLWRHAVETATIANMAALAKVSAEGAPSSAMGEGLADALNVGGI